VPIAPYLCVQLLSRLLFLNSSLSAFNSFHKPSSSSARNKDTTKVNQQIPPHNNRLQRPGPDSLAEQYPKTRPHLTTSLLIS
jgi:hypothetical protein